MYIDNSNNSNSKEIVIPFGKYKGMKLKELNTPKDAVYLHWIYPKTKGKLKSAIKEWLQIHE